MSQFRVIKPGEPAEPSPVMEAAQAALAKAIADGMQRGVILYETETGDGRAPILAGRATVRGLCEETLDDLLDGGDA